MIDSPNQPLTFCPSQRRQAHLYDIATTINNKRFKGDLKTASQCQRGPVQKELCHWTAGISREQEELVHTGRGGSVTLPPPLSSHCVLSASAGFPEATDCSSTALFLTFNDYCFHLFLLGALIWACPAFSYPLQTPQNREPNHVERKQPSPVTSIILGERKGKGERKGERKGREKKREGKGGREGKVIELPKLALGLCSSSHSEIKGDSYFDSLINSFSCFGLSDWFLFMLIH